MEEEPTGLEASAKPEGGNRNARARHLAVIVGGALTIIALTALAWFLYRLMDPS